MGWSESFIGQFGIYVLCNEFTYLQSPKPIHKTIVVGHNRFTISINNYHNKKASSYKLLETVKSWVKSKSSNYSKAFNDINYNFCCYLKPFLPEQQFYNRIKLFLEIQSPFSKNHIPH